MGKIGKEVEPIIIIPADLPVRAPGPGPSEPTPVEVPREPVPV